MLTIRSLLPVMFVALLVPACGDDDDDDDVVVVDPVQDTVDQGRAMGATLANTADLELSAETDYLVVVGKTASILAALNDGEIAQADFALQVVSANDIAAYAQMMIDDHTNSNAVLDEVLAGFGTDFIPSQTADDLTAVAMQGLTQLRETPPGEIDFAYINLQVQMHAAAQVLLPKLRTMVRDDAMGTFIDDTMVMIDDHLVEAEDLLATFF